MGFAAARERDFQHKNRSVVLRQEFPQPLKPETGIASLNL
jgi:hypothetical protein